jgi:hypothetical protein
MNTDQANTKTAGQFTLTFVLTFASMAIMYYSMLLSFAYAKIIPVMIKEKRQNYVVLAWETFWGVQYVELSDKHN